jgi:hypothetical protein
MNVEPIRQVKMIAVKANCRKLGKNRKPTLLIADDGSVDHVECELKHYCQDNCKFENP